MSNGEFEIEFLDDTGEPDGGPAAPQAPAVAAPMPVTAGVALLAWVAAAVLALAAPWQVIYRVNVPGPGSGGANPVLRIDGWGRLAADPDLTSSTAGHAARLGIILCVCAALFLLAAATAALLEWERRYRVGRRTSPPGLRQLAAALSVAGPALCAGTAGAAYLNVRSMVESARAASRSIGGATFPLYGYGSFLWYCLGAVLCAVVAAVAWLLASRARVPGLAG